VNKKLLSICLIALMGFTGCDGGNNSSMSSSVSEQNSSSIESVESSESVSSVEERSYFNGVYSNPTVVVNASGSDFKKEVADPSIVRGDDGYFYIFSTNGVVLRSEDACTFEVFAEKVIDQPTWWQECYEEAAGYGQWAPDVIKVQDKWIYYYSLSAWGKCCGIGYAISDNVAGPYEDQGKLFTVAEIGIQNCIDSQVIIDDDGSVYMVVGSFQGLYLLELTEDGMGLLGGVDYQKDNKVLVAGKPGNWDGSTYEGSYIIKEGEYYYYFGSAGTCCAQKDSTYRVYVARSKDIRGPYVDSSNHTFTMSGGGKTYGELVVWAGADSEKPIAGPGHNSILRDDKGDLWIYYHAYSEKDNFLTRHLFMDKLSWDDNGFPYVSYVDPETEKEVKKKPSLDIEFDGPSFFAD